MDNRPIGVFDSGVGGLTAMKELIKLLPNEDFIYFGDTARVPYGSHSKETIVEFAKQDTNFLLEKDVKAILIACGTVSSTSMEELQKMTSVPIVGVISAAAQRAVNIGKNILVLATPATIQSNAYMVAIKKLDSIAMVHEKACPLFVPLIENGYTGKNNLVMNSIVEDYTKQFYNQQIDAVILGCTHYPLISEVVQRKFPDATMVEAGKEAAYELKYILERRNLTADSKKVGQRKYFVSEITNSFKSVCKMFLDEDINDKIQLHRMD